jgi:predicted GNAT family N-acyltransferase
MYCSIIDFGTPEFDEAIRLRYDILRKPLNLEFNVEDIEKEYNEYHLGCYNSISNELVGVLTLKPLNNEIIKMRQVAVSKVQQSSGIGSFLVKASELFCKSKGYLKIELNARYEAVKFYLKNGYTAQGDIFQEVGIDHQFMFKNLD